jgi:hypothetical protein
MTATNIHATPKTAQDRQARAMIRCMALHWRDQELK